jgi:hypothetical protein
LGPYAWDTTKQAFVADAIWLALHHWHIFTHHHTINVVKIVVTYWKNMDILSDSALNEGVYQEIMLGHFRLAWLWEFFVSHQHFVPCSLYIQFCNFLPISILAIPICFPLPYHLLSNLKYMDEPQITIPT